MAAPGVQMFVLTMSLFTGAAHAGDGPSHLIAVRYRQGNVPRAIMDRFYFDADEMVDLAPELDFERPDVVTQVLGVDYTLPLMNDDAGIQFWAERLGTPVEAGLWNDREATFDPGQNDEQWMVPENLGAWSAGANFVYNVPILTSSRAFELKLGIGGGLGVGVVTGRAVVWKNGHQADLAEPACGPDDFAPQRKDLCASDGEVALPAVVPLVDITVGPRIRVLQKLLLRGDFGFHDSLYWGVAAGVAL